MLKSEGGPATIDTYLAPKLSRVLTISYGIGVGDMQNTDIPIKEKDGLKPNTSMRSGV
jgi:hypothetical protein